MPGFRIALACWRQETNTFNPNPTTLADYERFGLTADAEEIERRYRHVDELGGFFDVLDQDPKLTPVPLLRAVAWSGGRLTATARAELTHQLLARLTAESPVDAVLLALHGATAAEDEPDVAGSVVQAVRAAVGPAVPIGVSLDLHANLTPALVAAADIVVGYHANPHIDLVETGARTAELLLARLRGKLRPVSALRKVPVLIGAERQSTFEGPLGGLYDLIREAESSGRVLNANVYPVQPWLDVPTLSSAVLVTTDGDPQEAAAFAAQLADGLWAIRDHCSAERLPPEVIARRVAEAEAWPVIISDGADSTNSGAPGDSTVLPRAFLQHGTPGPLLVALVDPVAASACARAGVGAELTLTVGGRLDPRTGPPLTVTGRVRTLFDGRYAISGHGGQNVPVDSGLTAVLEAPPHVFVLTSHTFVGSHPNVYRSVGLEPAKARAAIARSPYGFRHDYGPIAAEILLADCPGAATGDYAALTFREVCGPLYPLQPLSDWRQPWTEALSVTTVARG